MKTLKGAVVRLSGGNVRNNHFYLRGMPWLPPEVIGGPNASSAAAEKLTVVFSNGQCIQTDVAGDKMILRDRGAVRKFFSDIKAQDGTEILIELVSPKEIHVSPKK
ncbi:hypothetical protein [Rhodovulum sp. P5]|uniref:hypothetical protein n=1 Tax=Rhodovulum sp. P5 TaxID=1564506 RepID=UPI0009DB08D2|nr:hypothetical protein [Rhodovulum sp. P5]